MDDWSKILALRVRDYVDPGREQETNQFLQRQQEALLEQSNNDDTVFDRLGWDNQPGYYHEKLAKKWAKEKGDLASNTKREEMRRYLQTNGGEALYMNRFLQEEPPEPQPFGKTDVYYDFKVPMAGAFYAWYSRSINSINAYEQIYYRTKFASIPSWIQKPLNTFSNIQDTVETVSKKLSKTADSLPEDAGTWFAGLGSTALLVGGGLILYNVTKK